MCSLQVCCLLHIMYNYLYVFFFKQKTAYEMRISDCSSDVCSSDLATGYQDDVDASRYWVSEKLDGVRGRWDGHALWTRGGHRVHAPAWFTERSEERRVGTECVGTCRSRL